MPAITSRHIMVAAALVFAVLTLGACGDERRYGDPGARPVAFTVHLERAYIRQLADRHIGVGIGGGESWSSNGGSSSGLGIGLTFSSTTVTLFGGDGVAEAQVFRQELKWGDNSFSVPLTPGRTLYLMVRAEGGHEGWESIGSFVAPGADAANPSVAIVLAGSGRTLTVTPPTAPPAGSATASSTATGASSTDATAAAVAPPDAPSQAPAIQVQPAPAPPAVSPAHNFPDPALDH